ncbi:MAG: HEAT repeat domain-containing protein [Candidatus Hydrogenedentota bacterium]|nr:MAG: HEAT repeat domain-containing protein [Candidatus Hydrogenedentota bacterium]
MKHAKKIALPLLFLPISIVIALSSRSSVRNHRIEDLEYALASEDVDVRLGAVVALTEYGEAAVPSLRKALEDDNPNVKKTAMKALGKIGGRRAADALAETLSDPRREMRVIAILALGIAGRSALPDLFRALETEPFPRARMFAAYSIARLAEPGDAPEILKCFDRQDLPTQMHLIIALVKIGDAEAYAGLSRLVKSPERLVRFYVASTIAEAPRKEALPILVTALNDRAFDVRMWAMFGLERLNLPESYPAVLAALQDECDYVRREAAYTLGNLGNRAAIPHLTSCLNDPYYLVRSNAAESLGKLGDPVVASSLKPLLAEPSPTVRIRAAEALARLSDYSGMETLIAVLDSPESLYRIHARRALRGLSNEDFGEDSKAWLDWWKQAKVKMEVSGRTGTSAKERPYLTQ